MDAGPGTREWKFAEVTLARNTRGVTRYDPKADNVTQPRAWIEFPKGRLVWKPSGAALVLGS